MAGFILDRNMVESTYTQEGPGNFEEHVKLVLFTHPIPTRYEV
jgi:hypothetical protein